MKNPTRFSILLAVTISLGLGGCSHFSKQARQQRAYEKYVRRSSYAQARQKLKLRPGKMQLPPIPKVSEPIMTAESGPQSVTSGSDSPAN